MKLSNVAAGLRKLYRAYQADLRAQQQTRAPRSQPSRPDGFQAFRRPHLDLGRAPPASAASDAKYVTGLYQELLGRAPDEAGLRSHLRGLATGMSREEIRQVFLNSPEYRERQAAPPVPAEPAPGPGPTVPGPTVPGPTPTEPGAPLSTVPLRPEYAQATIDKSSFAAAAKSAAQWVKDTYPELMARAADRQVDFEIMTHVIGALRAHGYDAYRVVNHASKAVGDGWRYGSDAVVLGGRIFDVYGGMGESNSPQAMDAGPNPPGRPRE